jgi:hypothetical protein
MAQTPTPAHKPAPSAADRTAAERAAAERSTGTGGPDRPNPTTEERTAAGAAAKRGLPFGAPMVQKAGRHLVAVGTVIHQADDGSRVIVHHGQPLPELDDKHMKRLERGGAAAKTAPIQPAPGVEMKQTEWTFDEEKGVWIDEQGSMHAPVPSPEDEERERERRTEERIREE